MEEKYDFFSLLEETPGQLSAQQEINAINSFDCSLLAQPPDDPITSIHNTIKSKQFIAAVTGQAAPIYTLGPQEDPEMERRRKNSKRLYERKQEKKKYIEELEKKLCSLTQENENLKAENGRLRKKAEALGME